MQAVLSGSLCNRQVKKGEAGSALLRVNVDNTVTYRINVNSGESDFNVYLSGFYRKRKSKVIEDLTSHFNGETALGKLKALGGKEVRSQKILF